MSNPFRIIPIPPGAPFCDRAEELGRLEGHARDRSRVVLHSPRRYGKTSLIRRVQARLADQGFVTAYVDFFGVDSVEDLALRLARGVYGAIHRRESLMDKGKRYLKALRSFRPVFRMSGEDMALFVEPSRPDATPLERLEGVLDDIRSFSRMSDSPLHIAFDEFQEMCRLKKSGSLEGVIRSQIQFHDRAAYVFAGSRRGVLQSMFSDSKRPFFQSAFQMELPPLPLGEAADFVRDRFREQDRDCPDPVCAALVERVEGYPYYVQRLAAEVFARAGNPVAAGDVDAAYESMVVAERVAFEPVISGLPGPQLRVLRTLAAAPSAELLSGSFVSKCGLPAATIAYSRDKLKAEDLIERVGQGSPQGAWKVVDPVFAEWLRRLDGSG